MPISNHSRRLIQLEIHSITVKIKQNYKLINSYNKCIVISIIKGLNQEDSFKNHKDYSYKLISYYKSKLELYKKK